MDRTEVMKIGRLGSSHQPYGPAWNTTFLNPPMTSPQVPQNLLRQTIMNGAKHMMGQLHAFDVVQPGQYPGNLGIPGIGFPKIEEAMGYAMGNSYATREFGGHGQRFVFGADNGASVGASAWLPGAQATTGVNMTWGLLSTASMAFSAWHGYRRNRTVPMALWWGLMGAIFPVVAPAIAVAQGAGKRKGR